MDAFINPDMSIIIDFSPKGGPANFSGTMTPEGLTFEDGNTWPVVPRTREDNLNNLMTEFGSATVTREQFTELALNISQSYQPEA